jgi:hypothetical protein
MGRQTGCIFKSKNGRRWFARWREDVIENGQCKRKLRFRDLAPVNDAYRTEKDVQPLLDELLRPINSGKARPESTLSVAEYARNHWLPWVRENSKPSTIAGYERFWDSYLAPHLEGIALRDFRTVDAANMLRDLHRAKGCGRTTLKHCKSILSGIFTLARNQGVLDMPNPVQGTMIPKKAAAPAEMHAATADEVVAILDAVEKAEVRTNRSRESSASRLKRQSRCNSSPGCALARRAAPIGKISTVSAWQCAARFGTRILPRPRPKSRQSPCRSSSR